MNLNWRMSAFPALIMLSATLFGCAATPKHELTPTQREILDQTGDRSPLGEISGCSDLVDGHIIRVPRESTERDVWAQYKSEFACLVKRYIAFREQQSEQGKSGNRMLFLVNGGLNHVAAIRGQAKEQIPLMIRDGYYPVFLAWDSALLSSYGEQVAYVRNGILRESIQATSPFTMVGDLLASIPYAPVILYNQSGRFLDSTVNSKDRADYRLEKFEYFPYARNSKNIRYGGDEIEARDHLKTARYFALTPLRLPASVLAQEIGKRTWEGMVRRTRNIVHHPGEFDPAFWNKTKSDSGEIDLDHRTDMMKRYPRGIGQFARLLADIERCRRNLEECDPPNGTGAGNSTYFDLDASTVEEFHKWLNSDEKSTHNRLRISLIGHSMGTMVLNELLPWFHDQLPIKDVVYMGAAASIRETQLSLERVLEKGKIQFYSLMLHPLNEAREDSAFSALPSGSLLEWIDEVLKEPNTVMDRTLGKWRNLRVAKHVFSEAAQNNMTFVVFPRSGRVPLTHGQFNETALTFWRESFWTGASFLSPTATQTSDLGQP